MDHLLWEELYKTQIEQQYYELSRRLELLKNAGYWDQGRIPKHDRLVLLPMPEASTRAWT